MTQTNLIYRPRIPRETRRLLIAVVIALAALWAFARLRFPEAPTPSNPVAPILSQLRGGSRLSDLATEVAQARTQIARWLAPWTVDGRAALRLRGEIALAWVPPPQTTTERLLARDAASGLHVLRISDQSLAPPPPAWIPEVNADPTYLMATSALGDRTMASPVLVDVVGQAYHPAWPGPIWRIDASPAPPEGAFLFTPLGHLAGLVIPLVDQLEGLGLVPTATLSQEADRLLTAPERQPGELGITIAPLSPALIKATGVASGVIVSRVDPAGPAATTVRVGDVVTALDSHTVHTPADWQVHTGRLQADHAVSLRIHQSGNVSEVALVPVSRLPGDAEAALGLELGAGSAGAEVVRVTPRSAAERAGLRVGDRITLIGTVTAPSPAVVRRTFSGLANGTAVVVGIERQGQPHVLALEKHAPRP